MPPEHKLIYRRITYHLSTFGAAIALLAAFGDTLAHTLLESIHLFMEMLEQLLDNFIEHFFHLERRDTQIIVFYILLVFGGCMIFLICKVLVVFWRQFRILVIRDYRALRNAVRDDWSSLTTPEKWLWASLFLMANYLLTYLFF